MTYLIAAFWTITTLFFVALTRREYFGVYHLIAIGQLPFYVLRPVLSHIQGEFLLYPQISPSIDYDEAYLTAYAFYVATWLGYTIRYMSEPPIPFDNTISQCPRSSLYILLPVASVIVVYTVLFLVGGTSWLSIYRSEAASVVVPAFRYAYPIVIGSVFFLMLAAFFKFALRGRWLPFIFCAGFSFVAVTLTNQRGQFVFITLLLLSFWLRLRPFKIKSLFFAGVSVYVALFVLRELLQSLVQGAPESYDAGDSYDWLTKHFLYTSTGDIIDTWMVVFDYVRSEGLALGRPLAAAPTVLLPLSARLAAGLQTSLDLLNVYYWGQLYYISSYGFNVNINQDLFLNFGYAGAVLCPVLGYAARVFEARLMTFADLSAPGLLKKYFLSSLLLLTFNAYEFHWVAFAGAMSLVAAFCRHLFGFGGAAERR